MTGKPKKTRKATAAERLAARALGRPEVDEIEVEEKSSGQLHYERLLAQQRSAGRSQGTATQGWDGWDGEEPPPAA